MSRISVTFLPLEAEFDAEADLANVSGDEDETGADEYEHEEITEVLPSQRKMEKEVNLTGFLKVVGPVEITLVFCKNIFS